MTDSSSEKLIWPISLLLSAVVVLLILKLEDPLASLAAVAAVPMVVWLCLRPKRLVYATIVYCFCCKLLVGDFGFPSILNYGYDGLIALALFFALLQERKASTSKRDWGIAGLIVLLFAFTCVASALLNTVQPMLFLWAFRNVFRFFAFFYCCVVFLDRKDVAFVVKAFGIVFLVNAVIICFQALVLGFGTDNSNGVFGTLSGGNAPSNLLLLCISAYTLYRYLDHRAGIFEVVLVIGVSALVASVADLKVYFIELGLLIPMALLSGRHSLKTFVLCLVMPILLIAGIAFLYTITPELAGFFSEDGVMGYAGGSGYSNADNLNRFTAITTLTNMFMTDGGKLAFGLGFGAGQYSQFFESPLYSVWGNTLNWTWFTDASIFLETGWVGLVLFGSFFVSVAYYAWSRRGTVPREDVWLMRASMCLALFCILLMVYNSTLTVDPGGYMIMLLLSFPYICVNDCKEETVVHVQA